MYSTSQPSTTEPQDVCTHLLGHLQAVIGEPAEKLATSDDWLNARAMLQTLPLSSDESRLALRRLDKVRRYFAANEPGAARFELRILCDALKIAE
jgi:predicted component of type VI protein secretion system